MNGAGTGEIIFRGAIFGVREENRVNRAVELRLRAKDFFLRTVEHACIFNESTATDARVKTERKSTFRDVQEDHN